MIKVLESPNKEAKVQGILATIVSHRQKVIFKHLDAKKSLSIDVDNDFEPRYFVNEDKEYVIKNLKRQYKQCHDVLLAPRTMTEKARYCVACCQCRV